MGSFWRAIGHAAVWIVGAGWIACGGGCERRVDFPNAAALDSFRQRGTLSVVASTGAASTPTAPKEKVSEKVSGKTKPATESLPKPEAKNPADSKADKHRFALLVGCTKYDHLPEQTHLKGPVNDVRFMRTMLIKQFHLPEENIVTLAEGAGSEARRPLKKNIVRQLKSLAERMQADDQVVLYFSGHGSQQPDKDLDPKVDPEPDGLDEVFCPADTKASPFEVVEEISNGLSDDELRKLVGAIRARGAFVWLIIDSCHSGTAVRGTRVYRQISPEALLPSATLQQARSRGVQTRGVGSQPAGWEGAEDGGMVAIYAAQPHEPTFEASLPGGQEDAVPCGVLTYALYQVIGASDSNMTYAELAQRIRDVYLVMGVMAPTPLIEGSGRDREILGEKQWPDRSRLTLTVGQEGKPAINAGRLHGMTVGSVLAVYPPAGSGKAKELAGYVKVVKTTATESIIEKCAYGETPELKKFPLGGRCEIAHVDYGDMRLRVAVDAAGSQKLSAAEAARWQKLLQTTAGKPGSVLQFVPKVDDAQWLIRSTKEGKLILVPAQGWPAAPDGSQGFGPIPGDDKAAPWIEDRLMRIAKAENLLKIAGMSQAQKSTGIFSALMGGSKSSLKIELRRLKDEEDTKGKPVVVESAGMKMKAGSVLGVHIENEGRAAMDVSLLFIDSGYGITSLYPPPDTVVDNRIEPGKSLQVGPMVIDGESVGREHLVVIGVQAAGRPVSLSWLAQDAIERTRALRATGESANDGPLEQLLGHAMFGQGQTRGMKMSKASETVMRVFSWETQR
ncbi:MAG: caspase family protein [Planctomycetes bacterium]|nr:caspase family protein [Planctomycetota bacterium]